MQLKEPLLKQGSTVTVMASLTECFTRFLDIKEIYTALYWKEIGHKIDRTYDSFCIKV